MQSLTNSVITGHIDQLIGEMTIEEAVGYLTFKWGEMMSFLIENPEMSLEEKDAIIGEIVLSLKDFGINDISYIQD
ncbi:MAG: hypothetical protein Q8M92_01115 [Candidatus Subteraquimicrobiales bacterium]|nr:hypothetical protein [Candidatus Subteraquimicrobiales bacterium]